MDNDALYSLLSSMGYSYSIAGREAHLTMAIGDMRWNMALHASREAFVIYSQFPFELCDEEVALKYCNRANASLLEGAFVFDKNRVVVRTASWRTDGFYIREQLRQSIERNAAIMTKHWAVLSRAAGRV